MELVMGVAKGVTYLHCELCLSLSINSAVICSSTAKDIVHSDIRAVCLFKSRNVSNES